MRDYVFQHKEELRPVYRRSRPTRRSSDRGVRVLQLDTRIATPIR
jgi:hypothetical protein